MDSGVTSLLSLVVVLASIRIGGVDAAGQVALLASVVLASIGFFRLGIAVPFLTSISSGRAKPTSMVSSVILPAATTVAVGGALLATVSHSFIIFAGALWVSTALLQDAERYVLIAREKYRRLLLIDILVLLFVFVGQFFANSPAGIALAVSFGLIVSTVIARGFSRKIPHIGVRTSFRTWWREHRTSAGPLLIDGLVFTIVSQSLVWILAIRSDVDEVGLLRIALIVAFPLSVIQSGVSNPILQKLAALNLNEVARVSQKYALRLMAAASCLALASLLLLPVINRIMLTPPAKVGLWLAIFVLGNAVLIFSAEPLNRACIVRGRVMGMALWRALSGTFAFLIVLTTTAGLSATGVALAIFIGQSVLIVSLSLMLWVRGTSPANGELRSLQGE